ncbi:transposase [Kitasatospora sp. MMS16-BH015]|uniref:transposase n=1 Tax=Kitasatospora sp. MMS16-BH015 TaxID=2018025 RepID=UPI000CF1F571
MSNKQGKRYSEEFKRDAVRLARSSSKTVTEVARDLGAAPRACGAGSSETRSTSTRSP